MPSHLTQALGDLNGKPNSDVSFEAELVFRNVIAPVLESGFLTRADIRNLDKATPLVGIYQSIKRDYGTTDPSKIRGRNRLQQRKNTPLLSSVIPSQL
jgi:hypothetical protein